MLRAAQEATRAATGHEGELRTEPWAPHITLAYGNSARSARPVIDALGRELPRQEVTITSVSLVSQTPEQMFTWNLITDVAFAVSEANEAPEGSQPTAVPKSAPYI